SVVAPVARDQRLRSRCGEAVAANALGLHMDRPGQVQRSARRRVALSADFASVRVISELLNEIRLPVRGPVTRVGRIQSGLLVRIVRMALVKPQKVLAGRV